MKLVHFQLFHSADVPGIMFGSGLFGSGSGDLQLCDCQREVECSFAGTYNGTQV